MNFFNLFPHKIFYLVDLHLKNNNNWINLPANLNVKKGGEFQNFVVDDFKGQTKKIRCFEQLHGVSKQSAFFQVTIKNRP